MTTNTPPAAFCITRVETIEYVRVFTRAELLAAGFTVDHLESATDLTDALASGRPWAPALREYVEQETGRHGDVQGSTFETSKVVSA